MSLTAKMDETRIDDRIDDRIEASARVGDVQSRMPLPRFCSLAHLCPLLEFVMMSLNTGQHEVEGVAAIHLSFLGPRSRQIRFIANNRYL